MWTLIFDNVDFLTYENEEKLFEDLSKVTKYKGVRFRSALDFVFIENMDLKTWNEIRNRKTHFPYMNHPKGDFE